MNPNPLLFLFCRGDESFFFRPAKCDFFEILACCHFFKYVISYRNLFFNPDIFGIQDANIKAKKKGTQGGYQSGSSCLRPDESTTQRCFFFKMSIKDWALYIIHHASVIKQASGINQASIRHQYHHHHHHRHRHHHHHHHQHPRLHRHVVSFTSAFSPLNIRVISPYQHPEAL